MPTLIPSPTVVEAAGNKPKLIREYVGRANSDTTGLSIAHMQSPGGWTEPGQQPEFDEYTLVLRGMLRVEHVSGALDVSAGQAVRVPAGEWVRYSTPETEVPTAWRCACQPSRLTWSTAMRDSSSG